MQQPPNFLYKLYLAYSDTQLAAQLQTSFTTGLHSDEIADRVKRFGRNSIDTARVSWIQILFSQVASPFVLIFIGLFLVYLSIGQYTEGFIVGLIVCINMVIGLYQEWRVALNMQLLQEHAVLHTTVLRDGSWHTIAVTQLVPGDIISVALGDIIPADCRFIAVENLSIDESLLTGESVEVAKTADPLLSMQDDIFHAANIGFAGTSVASGNAKAVVFAIGAQTQLGHLAFLSVHQIRESSLAQGTHQLAVLTGYVILATVVLMSLVGLFVAHDRSWIDYFIFISALAMSVIPEALPLIVTFCLSQGASRLAGKHMVVKRLSAIEDLGAIQILCTDKTGTLTENSLELIGCHAADTAATCWYAILADLPLPGTEHQLRGFTKALLYGLTDEQHQDLAMCVLRSEIPFDPVHRKNIAVVEYGESLILVVRATVEGALAARITDTESKNWIVQHEQQGHRVLAVFVRSWRKDNAPAFDQILSYADQAEFMGLLAFADPVKKTAFEAVRQAQQMDIQLKIMSGDSADVCTAVAQQLHIITHTNQVITGADFDAASAQEQQRLVHTKTVFARVTPEQKFRIIHALQQTHLVGYLGDGINDAPALKAAHVSMVVQGAAHVAQQAADIIMLKKSLAAIIDGIQEGRKTFVNTLKYITIATVANGGNFISLVIASFLLDYLPMLPLHILLENLITDLPMVGLATDTVLPSELQVHRTYNPRDIFSKVMVFGALICIRNIVIYWLFAPLGASVLQTSWFITSTLTELMLIFLLRSNRLMWHSSIPSLPVIALSLLVGAVTMLTPYTVFGQTVLLFVPLSLHTMVTVIAITVVYSGVNEVIKLIYYRVVHRNYLI